MSPSPQERYAYTATLAELRRAIDAFDANIRQSMTSELPVVDDQAGREVATLARLHAAWLGASRPFRAPRR